MRKFKQFLNKPTPSVDELVAKHKVPKEHIEQELAHGIEVEKEHTNSPAVAREIALDHLGEMPDYYTRLKKVESGK